jgi:hypothetical protein
MAHHKMTIFFVLLSLAALLGMALVFYATSLGPGVGGDATIYLTTARNLISGKGLGWTEADGSYRLLPYTPPFYPLALSGVGLIAKDMLAGARWLNILLFGLLIFMVGWFFYQYTRRTWLAALLGGVLAASPVILGVQVWAMSESIFLLLGFAGLLLVLEYLARPTGVKLVFAALLCGLAFLTRYIGVAFVVTGGLALLLLGRSDNRHIRLNLRWEALRSALVFGFLGILPALAWLVIDYALTGTVGSRSAQPVAAYWQRFLEMGPALEKIVLFWLVPESVISRLPGIARLALWLVPLAAVITLALVLARRAGKAAHLEPASPTDSLRAASIRLTAMFGLFIIVYLVVLAMVQVFTFPPITLASRMLSPVHLAVLVLIFALLHLALDVLAPRSTVALGLVYLACLGLFGAYALRGVLVVRDYHNTGIGYMSPEWQNSTTLKMLRELSPDTPIITNETTAVMFFLNRPAYAIQEIYQNEPAAAFNTYGMGDDPAQQVFRKGGALVLFKSTLRDDFAMYGDRVDERLNALVRGLTAVHDDSDGAIYFFSPPPGASAKDDPCG